MNVSWPFGPNFSRRAQEGSPLEIPLKIFTIPSRCSINPDAPKYLDPSYRFLNLWLLPME